MHGDIVFLLKPAVAEAVKAGSPLDATQTARAVEPVQPRGAEQEPPPETESTRDSEHTVVRVAGTIPPDSWNRFGTKVLPKLRSGAGLTVTVDLAATLAADTARNVVADIGQVLDELALATEVTVVTEPRRSSI
jgi:hypothetical protein